MRAVLLLLVLLGGCSTIKEEPIPQPEAVPPVVVHPALPSPVQLTPPKFYIITENNCQAVFKEESAYFGVTSGGYTSLAGNIQELRRYILELQSLIVFYKDSLRYWQEAAHARKDESNTISNAR